MATWVDAFSSVILMSHSTYGTVFPTYPGYKHGSLYQNSPGWVVPMSPFHIRDRLSCATPCFTCYSLLEQTQLEGIYNLLS